ncbi:MAG: chemotaxis protein histidine kinase CheA [Planctomycetota bacterium]
MRRGRDESSPVDLFPFTAVLLSAMGALVVMLFAMTSANAADADPPAARPQRAHVELQALLDLIAEREADAESLAQGWAEHEQFESKSEEMEDDVVRLQEDLEQDRTRRQRPGVQVDELRQRIAELSQLEGDAGTRVAAQLASIAEQNANAEDRETQLSQRQQEFEDQRDRVPVVWRGASETNLRPVFYDCTAKAVSQVDGKSYDLGIDDPEFTSADNAFTAHMKELKKDDRYAVFIVRSSGIRIYDLAVQLCGRADASYGYIVVEDDVVLEFPAEVTTQER